MEWLLALLPFLLILACPLVMLFCVVGMRKTGCSPQTAPTTNVPTATTQGLSTEQITVLQARLAQLQTEQEAIAQQLAILAAANAMVASHAPGALLVSDDSLVVPTVATSRP